VRTDKPDPASNEEATAVWRITLKDPDERKVGRAVVNAVTEIALATIPGFYGVSGSPSPGGPYGVYRPATIPADVVPQHVVVLDGDVTVVDSVAPDRPCAPIVGATRQARVPGGPSVTVALGTIIGARSGDKGGHANLGLFARTDEAWAWLDDSLSVARLKSCFPRPPPWWSIVSPSRRCAPSTS